MGKFDSKSRPTPPPINSLVIYLYDKANGQPLTGRVHVKDGIPESLDIWGVCVGSIEFGPIATHNYNIDIYVDGYKDAWVGVEVTPKEPIKVYLEKIVITKPVFDIPTGIVKTTQSSAFDDRGYHLFLGTTLFPYRWMLDNNELRLDENLQYLAENKVDYIRYFVEVGNPNDDTDGWSDRKTDPSTFSERYINYAYVNYGIRSAICIFGGCFYSDTPEKRKVAVQKVIDIVRANKEKITWIEIVNEFRGQLNDPDEVRYLCRMVQDQLPDILCIPSSPEGWQEDFDTIYKDNTGRLLSIHHERTDKERMWGYVRGPWSARELVNVPNVGVNDEGQGPKSSGARDDDPLRLAFFAATSWLTKQPFFTLHTGAGVYMGGKGGYSHNREANIYDVNNIDSIFDYINNVREIMPQDVTSWGKYNGNVNEHLLPADHVWPDGFDDGPVRTYMGKTDINFVMLPYGILNFTDHTARVPMTISQYDIRNKGLIRIATLNPGDKIRFNGKPDANEGWIVLGSF